MKMKGALIAYVALVISCISLVMSSITIVKLSKVNGSKETADEKTDSSTYETDGEEDFTLTLIKVHTDWAGENGGFYATEYEAEFKHEYQDCFDKCRYCCTKKDPNLLEHIGNGEFDISKLREIEEIIKWNGLVWFEEEVVDENGMAVRREIDRNKTKVLVRVEIS